MEGYEIRPADEGWFQHDTGQWIPRVTASGQDTLQTAHGQGDGRVAYHNGEPVASVTWQETPEAIMLGSAYTHPDHRGQGLFNLLTDDVRNSGKPVDAYHWENPWLKNKVRDWRTSSLDIADPAIRYSQNGYKQSGMTLPQEQRRWEQLGALRSGQSQPVHSFPNGWTVQDHPTYGDVNAVGQMMHNCWQQQIYGGDPDDPIATADLIANPYDRPQYTYRYQALHDPHDIPRVAFFQRSNNWSATDQPQVVAALVARNLNHDPEHHQMLKDYADTYGYKFNVPEPQAMRQLLEQPAMNAMQGIIGEPVDARCTGHRDPTSGQLIHDGDTCPIHEDLPHFASQPVIRNQAHIYTRPSKSSQVVIEAGSDDRLADWHATPESDGLYAPGDEVVIDDPSHAFHGQPADVLTGPYTMTTDDGVTRQVHNIGVGRDGDYWKQYGWATFDQMQPAHAPEHPDPWMDNEPGTLTLPKHWGAWAPEGWDAPEPYSPQGDRCPMCKNHRLIAMPSDSERLPDSLICPECNWAGTRAPDWLREIGDSLPSADDPHTAAVGPTYYHVAPASARESIQANGLDHTLGQRGTDYGGHIINEPGNYLWTDPEHAENNRQGHEPAADWDVWHVNAQGLNLQPDREWGGCHYTTEPIGSERLSLASHASSIAHIAVPPPQTPHIARTRSAGAVALTAHTHSTAPTQPSPHLLLHDKGSPARGIIEPNGRVHTWPEDWGTHGAYAHANDLTNGWAPFYVRPDGSAYGPALTNQANEYPLQQAGLSTQRMSTVSAVNSAVHRCSKCRRGRTSRSPYCSFCDRSPHWAPKISTQGSSKVSGPMPDGTGQEVPAGPYYHGTTAELASGDLLTPSNTPRPDLDHYDPSLTYATTGAHLAERYAVGKAGREGGEPRIYEVEPTGDVIRDPEYHATGFGSDQVAAPGFRVVREIPLPGLCHWDNGLMRGPRHGSLFEDSPYTGIRMAMAERSGVPELDAAIEEFMAGPFKSTQTTETDLGSYREPQAAFGNCEIVANALTEFLKAKGFNAYTTQDETEAFYPGAMQNAVKSYEGNEPYPEHAVTSVYLPGRPMPVEIDFTASQYGFTEFPKVSAAESCPNCGATDEFQGGLCYSCGYGSKPCPRCGNETQDGHCYSCGMDIPQEVSQKELGKPKCQNCGSTDMGQMTYNGQALYQCRDCASYTRIPGEGLNVERDVKMPVYSLPELGPVRQGKLFPGFGAESA